VAPPGAVLTAGGYPGLGFQGFFKVTGRLIWGCVAGLVDVRSAKERAMSVRDRRLAMAGVIAAECHAFLAGRPAATPTARRDRTLNHSLRATQRARPPTMRAAPNLNGIHIMRN
jgi:hypothetical protein